MAGNVRGIGKTNKKKIFWIIAILLGILLRYLVMLFGYNFDFESYCIVGDIAGHFRNVYAETARYNYAPVFFCFQGSFYRLSELFGSNQILVYRILIVGLLTATDLGIAFFAKRYSLKAAVIFFLNPVSILITGYHNQFDNMAVLAALISILYYNEESKIGKKDLGFVLFMSLGLMIKHLLFVFPLFILLKKGLPIAKKALYAFAPPIIFLISFVPFVIGNSDALNGVVNNVFLYRSRNNAPLLSDLFNVFQIPNTFKFVFFILAMCGLAIFARKLQFDQCVFLYLMGLVVFSSAISNQYLAIPLVAICVLDTGFLKYLYMVVVSIFIVLNDNGLNVLRYLQQTNSTWVVKCAETYNARGHWMAVWILLIVMLYVFVWKRYFHKKRIIEKDKE